MRAARTSCPWCSTTRGRADAVDPQPPGERAGIVAVTPDVVKGTAPFADLERHAELAHRPIIGVITYRGRAGRRRSDSRATARQAASADVDELDPRRRSAS